MRPTRFATCVALTVVLLAAATAEAATLAPGALLTPVPAEAEPVGGVVLATQTSPFVSTTYTGELTSTVISGDTSNTLGGLTFTYVLRNLTGTHSINRLSINGFDDFRTDVGRAAPAGTIVPAYADREASGTSIGFSWVSAPIGSGAIAAGQTSATLVVQTNSPVFVPTSAFVLDGFPAGMLAFAPVPEPSTFVLAGTGLALMVYGFSRRRRSGR
ncbi:MAG: PEP-CTERM sorting domain-containing protein [Pirellulales bacterium]